MYSDVTAKLRYEAAWPYIATGFDSCKKGFLTGYKSWMGKDSVMLGKYFLNLQ
jgi:hypothetical protein